jgi:GLPGLI family protein
MKYFFLLFILFLNYTAITSQNNRLVDVEFTSSIRKDSININWQANYNLQLAGSRSLYFKSVFENEKENTNEVRFTPKNKSENENKIFKDYIKNEIYSKDLISLRFFTIKDSINNFKWNITDKEKKILEYNCKMAIGNFRGRTFLVWFTSELPSGGPWKLDGLPGLILKADTEDGYYSVEAASIRITNNLEQETIINNPFVNESLYLSWEEFKQKYKEKAIKVSKYRTDDSNVLIHTPKIKKERYISEDDKDYNFKTFLKITNNKFIKTKKCVFF